MKFLSAFTASGSLISPLAAAGAVSVASSPDPDARVAETMATLQQYIDAVDSQSAVDASAVFWALIIIAVLWNPLVIDLGKRIGHIGLDRLETPEPARPPDPLEPDHKPRQEQRSTP